MLATLKSGGVDIIHNSTATVTAQLRADTSLGYTDDSEHVAGEPDMNFLLLNLSKPPFDNGKVRQAAAMAVDSAQYSKVIDQGICPASTGPFASGSPYFAPTDYPEPDPAKAKQLITEVRQESGQPVVVTIAHVPDPATARIAEYLQQQFENAGMQVSLATIQQAQAISTALSGSFQSLVWQQFGAVNPDLNYIFWSPTNAVQAFAGNMARNTDPNMETALLKGRQSPAQSDRVAAYQEVGRLMGSDIPYVWTDRTVWSIGAQPKVQNWNNPTTPAGKPAFGMITGAIWPTQIWLGS